MKKERLNSLAELLHTQRNNYLQEFRKAEAALDSIAEERESELEEHAQEEQSARFLTRLDDRTLCAVKEIDAALELIHRKETLQLTSKVQRVLIVPVVVGLDA